MWESRRREYCKGGIKVVQIEGDDGHQRQEKRRWMAPTECGGQKN